MKAKASFFLLGLLAGLLALACNVSSSLPWNQATSTPLPSLTATFTPPPTPTPTLPPTPTPVPAMRIGGGDRALFLGNWEEALSEYELAQAASDAPDIQAAAWLGIGRSRLMERNYHEAVAAFEKLAVGYPDSLHSATAYFFLGQAYSAQELYPQAAQAYQEYLTRRPGVIDAYVLDLRGEALFAAGDYPGAAQAFVQALQVPSLLDATFLRMKIARAKALSGDHAAAIALYDEIYAQTGDDSTRALIDLRKGDAYTALGQTDQAIAAYQDAVLNYPTSYEAYLSLVALVEAGVQVDELQRGVVDYYAGEYGAATAAFDRYLQSQPADPGTAHYYYALSNRAQGGNEEAITRWEKVIRDYEDHRLWADAWDQKAYTQWAFLELYEQATQTYLDFVETAPGHPRAGEFLFEAAQVAERSGNLDQAIEVWGRLVSEYPNDERVDRALFLTGIAHYRKGVYPLAMTAFQRFLSSANSLEDRAAAHLWIGKTHQALGDPSSADAAWQVASGIDPTGYYSERARDLLHDRQPFTPPEGYDLMYDQQAERQRAEAWMRSTFKLPENTDLSGLGPLVVDPNLSRGTELWNLGLYDEARAEFEFLRQALQTDPAGSYRLANYLLELGAYRSAIMSMRQVLDQALLDDATTLSAPAYFNYIRFGSYFSELVMPLAEEYAFHPLFLFSVMRQESLFDSQVRSSADARGLMQIIPTTGEDIASNLGWPPDYADADLFRPMVNLTLGTDYMDTQRELFDGDLSAALAAYNGGPGNAQAWHRLAPNDPDLFLEVIRYEETRKYLRGIYELFTIYRLIYNRTS